MRFVLPTALVLLQVLLSPNLSSASVNLTGGIATPPTFPTFRLPAVTDGWAANHDLSANWTAVSDRLAVWLNASGTDAISNIASGLNVSATDATSSLAYGLRYPLSKDLSWTVQGFVSGSQGGTQTMLQYSYSPSADWYMRGFVSGLSSGDGTSSTTQQVQVGYQGHAGPQVSVTVARQLFGIAVFDSTIFMVGASLHDVSAQFDYKTTTVTFAEFSTVQTLHYPTFSVTFPIKGWWWTVSGMMGDASNVMVTFSREDSNLSGKLSLAPLGFGLSYETKF